MGQALITAIQLIKENRKHFFKTAIMMVLPLFLAASTLSFLTKGNYDPASTTAELLLHQFASPMSLVSILASYLYTLSCSWAGVYYVKLYLEKGPGNFEMADLWSEVFKDGWKLLFAFILIAILTLIVVLVAGFLAGITLVLIPVFYFWLLFVGVFIILFGTIFLVESNGFSNSIDRVFKLMKGKWLSGAGLMIVCILIPFSFIFSPMLIMAIIDIDSFRDIFELSSGAYSVSLVLLFQNVLQILGLLYLLLLNIAFAVFYFSLSEEKDHVSLKSRIENLGPLGSYQ